MIVYKARNRINGKIYIGATKQTLTTRISQHVSDSERNSGVAFHLAIQRYGKNVFDWEVLRICNSIKSLSAFEQYFILYYDSMNNGYNCTSGGKNYTISEEYRKKLSQSNPRYWLNKKRPKESRKKMSKSHLGIKHTKEAKEKIRQANLGKKLSEETKKKISDSHKGKNNYWYGKKLSEEHKKNVSLGKIAQLKRDKK